MRQIKLTAVIEREDDGFVALCPEVDIASQGETVDEARRMLEQHRFVTGATTRQPPGAPEV